MTERVTRIIKEQQAKLRAGLADHFYENSEPAAPRFDGSRFQRLDTGDKLLRSSQQRPLAYREKYAVIL